FRIPFLEKKAMDDVASVIADVLYLKVIQIPPLHDAVMYDFAWDCIRDLGYSCDSTLAETLFARIRKEKQDGRFYGFKTVEKIINEAVLIKANRDAAEEYAGRTVDRKTIMPADVEALNPKEKAKKTGYDELAELIGMEKITQKVREIVAQVRYSMKQEKVDRPCIHMRFVGSPGTGKTTVARIIGQIFREEGILRKGAFMEYSARSLCAEYVGQTAVRTAAICRDAYGSVLFIDEAYALYDGSRSSNDYGREALTTLISEMENHRDDMLVIMAGYTDDMETLMQGNAGLRSRMPFMIEFPNYTRTQLYEIFMLMVRKNFDYEPGLEEEVRKFFDSISQEYYDSHEFANARFVRNLYERTWSKGATRAALEGLPRLKLTKQDFLAASGEKEFGEKLQKETRIGF
ncbi:MAG: AAA family ATPase, partial [Clostridia bacterium]|nr:AAA family ATPase [Clostridia bacterium]